MTVTGLLWTFLALLGGILLARPLARLLRLPLPPVLVLIGFIGSEAVVALGLDTGLRARSFQELVFFVFLPVLVFEAAYQIDQAELLRQLPRILMLAIGVMLGTTCIAAGLLYFGIGHPTGFPWLAALITGTIIAATDPASVLANMKRLGGPHDARILLEGESLFNDASAIVLFGLLLSLALEPDASFTAAGSFFAFVGVFFGGILCGLVAAAIGWLLLRWFRDAESVVLITLFLAYAAFLVTELTLHLSGVLATLTCGLCLSRIARPLLAEETREEIRFFWEFGGGLCGAVVFLLMGVTITLAMFEERWLAMLIGIAAVLLARCVCVFGAFALIRPVLAKPVSSRYQWLLVWSGTRGAVTLALALSLPLDLESWWTIQSIAVGVVCFSLFVQAPTGGLAMRQLGFLRP